MWYNKSIGETFDDFEFERRFFCFEFPEEYDSGLPPNLIIQNYYLSSEGYAIRIRVQSDAKVDLSAQQSALEVLEQHQDTFDLATMTVKGPSLGGTRYEVEHSLDPYVALELVKRGGKTIIKNRYSAWIGQDGWVVDIFGGSNTGLVIAECERMSPVIDLEIPKFCIEEVTDQAAFTNDSLVNTPYSEFREQYLAGLQERLQNSEAHFSKAFGENRRA